MPIYSYRCEQCGHQQDVLQKMSDPLLVTCPACGADAYRKQVTAAGFQLKGSGWYVTDFRNPPAKTAPKADDGTAAKPDAPAAAPAPAGDTASAPAPAPAPAKADPPAASPPPSGTH